MRLVEEAKALLSHRAPRVTFEEIQLRALRGFVEALRQRKYGSRQPDAATTHDGIRSEATATRSIASDVVRTAAPSGQESAPGAAHDAPEDDSGAKATTPNPRRRGRYIPASVRRAVATRDHHRCTYVDASGRRCAETQRLEFHHVVPFAVCRSHEVKNLTLRCQAHNALARKMILAAT